MNLTSLEVIARKEVEGLLQRLPPELSAFRTIPVVCMPIPTSSMRKEDQIHPDTLGLFLGTDLPDTLSSENPLPTVVILFIQNLWDYSEKNETVFRREVRKTYLHELGHYLGLDEDELQLRGLE